MEVEQNWAEDDSMKMLQTTLIGRKKSPRNVRSNCNTTRNRHSSSDKNKEDNGQNMGLA